MVWRRLTGGTTREVRDILDEPVVAPERRPDDVLALLAHDLVDPLVAVSGMARLLLERHAPGLEPETRHLVETIASSSDRAHEVVRRAVEFARADAMDDPRELVDLGAVSDEVLDMLAPLAQECGATVERTSMPEIWGRVLPIRHVIQNLVTNAIRHGGDDPHVLVTARSGSDAVICVRDDGPGLPADVVAWLAGDGARPTRLGLALTRRLVSLEGGRLWAEQQPDHHGTVMCASFPQRRGH